MNQTKLKASMQRLGKLTDAELVKRVTVRDLRVNTEAALAELHRRYPELRKRVPSPSAENIHTWLALQK